MENKEFPGVNETHDFRQIPPGKRREGVVDIGLVRTCGVEKFHGRDRVNRDIEWVKRESQVPVPINKALLFHCRTNSSIRYRFRGLFS